MKNMVVDIRAASFAYGRTSKNILNDITIQVQQGTIYGLLGPSGCGKTTLLDCVIGLLTVKSGEVKVFGEKPGSKKCIVPGRGVGYMPQECSLYSDLSIWESLLYFGRLHRVEQATVKERSQLLLEFLNLPSKSILVGKLSSGQQRRVSLAVALIHSPPLLVLDEPTVGVDPVLRKCIWDYLVQLATKDGITTIVTTHYIEEASQAHTVGFMRNGRILKQTNPLRELEEFNETSIEESFLRICRNNTSDNIEGFDIPKTSLLRVKKGSNVRIHSDICDSEKPNGIEISPKEYSTDKAQNVYRSAIVESIWKDGFYKIGAILQKEARRIKRNIPLLILQFFLPGLTILLFSVCMSKPPFDLRLAIVNEESPAAVSLTYLESIEYQEIIQVPYPDLESALTSVKKGHSWGIIHIPRNFTKCLFLRIMEGTNASEESVVGSNVLVYLDSTVPPIMHYLQMVIFKSFHKFILSAYENMGLPSYSTDVVIQMGEPIYSGKEHNFNTFTVPGLILMISYSMGVALTTLILLQDRENNFLQRTWICKVSSLQIITAHFISQLIVLLVQNFFTLLGFILAMNVSFEGGFILTALMTVLEGICGMTLGLLFSSVGTDPSGIMLAAIGHVIPLYVLCGILWPLESQPYWLRYISMSLPPTMPISALRSVMNRGWGIEKTEVWSAILIQLAWITGSLVIAVKLFKVKK